MKLSGVPAGHLRIVGTPRTLLANTFRGSVLREGRYFTVCKVGEVPSGVIFGKTLNWLHDC